MITRAYRLHTQTTSSLSGFWQPRVYNTLQFCVDDTHAYSTQAQNARYMVLKKVVNLRFPLSEVQNLKISQLCESQ